jgi:small subunit ribosomal protein S3Ae
LWDCSVDPFSKKDWYDIKAPTIFTQRSLGKTLVTRTAGTKIASDGLKGRVFEVSLADLQQDEDQAFRKIKLRAEDVQGKNVLTNFWVSALGFCRLLETVFYPLRWLMRRLIWQVC